MMHLHNQKKSTAFTLVEMLVAMAITMLMMAALARAFGFVGEAVKDSRADVEMSGRLVDINARLADELKRCTVSLQPAVETDDPLGYFLYSEGPVTDVTSSVFRATPDADGNLIDARYGDFDDYLAFTAVAKGNSWFTGKVPRFLLDMKKVDLLPVNQDASTTNDVAYDPTQFPGLPLDPIVIESKYAELVYFASPEYVVSSLSTAPVFVDDDNNLLPDRLNLHRRVLLIRPDLVLTSPTDAVGTEGALAVYPVVTGATALRWMRADDWPIGNTTVHTTNLAPATDPAAWQYGMAGVHQQCDLSLRRRFDATGQHLPTVAANSLSDLSKPHNRFGHIRVPSAAIGGSGSAITSMPILALGGPPAVLGAATTGSDQVPPPLGPVIPTGESSVLTPYQFSGFIRPEFVLGTNVAHREVAGDAWGSERLGEDLLTNNALAFDVQIYDPQVTQFSTSNGLVVGPNDSGYRQAVLEKIAAVTSGSTPVRETSQGGFVDLAYPILAGGSLRGWRPRLADSQATATTLAVGTTNNYLNTPFSGVSQSSTSAYILSDALQRSGRLISDASGNIRLFQPAFDTYTTAYEVDGMLQGAVPSANGSQWRDVTDISLVDLGADGIDGDVNAGADDVDERETLPPFIDRPEAIRVTIRIENPSTRLIRQASVVHRD
ncbi:PulJ/GspJ family protein [Planctomycetes bacterium K23_9]|uniref:Uncharacterized protein n=1 Tax=Stieleria marina TaxID=1930275 RepID=A0A517NQS3_9BACT|nr:hypothetical protein K239x_14170 [Planctomycetes bacterium K23_9]